MWPECLTVPAPAPHWLSESSTWSSLRRDESCQWPRPAGWCGHCPSSLRLIWSSTATSQLHADWGRSGWAGLGWAGRAARARSASTWALAALQAQLAAPLCCFEWGHFKDGDLRGCISKSSRESWSVTEKKQIKFVHFTSIPSTQISSWE